MGNCPGKSSTVSTEPHQNNCFFDNSKHKVTLDRYNSDLALELTDYSGQPLSKDGFAYIWNGVRSTHGILPDQRVCFQVKITSENDVNHMEPTETCRHVIRIGWSSNDTSLSLGEEPRSFGFGGTGRASLNGRFFRYGSPFGCGDVITSFLDYSKSTVKIWYSLNDQELGQAFQVDSTELNGSALFPHIYTKNCCFEVNFGQLSEPMSGQIGDDMTWIGRSRPDSLQSASPAPSSVGHCQVIMMIGLPASGKSCWVDAYLQDHRDQRFDVIGANTILEKMKVMNMARKGNFHGRWESLIRRSSSCTDTLLHLASQRRRNVIIDQSNVAAATRLRKLNLFEGFRKVAVVVVPTHEVYLERCSEQSAQGKHVPDEVFGHKKANFELPQRGEPFDEVVYAELPATKAADLVKRYNVEARAAGFKKATLRTI